MTSVLDMLARARKLAQGDAVQTGERFKEILGIVRKHGIHEGLTPEKVVALLQDLGPTFVKLGQIASTHPDVLPAEYCEALGSLRTNASPLTYEEVRSAVENELGRPLDELFQQFDQQPAGSASIAQVHRAVLPDGVVVAVKVQRPGVVETVTSDLAIMERLVDLYDLVSRGDGKLSFKELVDEMVRTSTLELDFRNEAANLERFHRNNEERAGVYSPACYPDLCTSAVLTEDYASAPCVEKIDGLGMSDEQRERLAYLVAQNYMQQFMEDGFYHADPHAGNVLVREDGIEWIDFGMMGTMTSSQRASLEDAVMAMVKGDAYSLKRALLKMATPKGPIDHGVMLEKCEALMDQLVGTDLESFDTGTIVNKMFGMLDEQGFDVDSFLVNLGRGLVTLEGTIHLISPNLNIGTVLTEYLRGTFSPEKVKAQVQRMAGRAVESAEAMAGLPVTAAATLDMLQRGQVKVGMELSANERLSRDLRAVAGVLALALIAMALIIGSCILGASEAAVRVAGISVAGALGLAGGLALAAYVIVKVRPLLK